MRMPAETVYVYGVWYVGFERVAAMAIWSRMIASGPRGRSITRCLLVAEGGEVKTIDDRPDETETQFFFRCDRAMYELATTLAEQPLSGPLVVPLVYRQVLGDMSDATSVLEKIDPGGARRKWFVKDGNIAEQLKNQRLTAAVEEVVGKLAKAAGISIGQIEVIKL